MAQRNTGWLLRKSGETDLAVISLYRVLLTPSGLSLTY